MIEDGKRIRKLTPKECFRLQGWADNYFEKAQFVNSDTQLYRQAGNGVTVNVIEAIGKRITTMESEEDMTVNGSTYLLTVRKAGKTPAP